MNIFHGYEYREKNLVIQSDSGLQLTANGLGLKRLIQIWSHPVGIQYEEEYTLRHNITNYRMIYATAIKDDNIESCQTRY